MAIQSRTNLYPGINPHLNNALQQKGGDWRSFHTYHIINIADFLDEHLPESYIAKPEKSLQVGTYDGEIQIRRTAPVSDILIIRDDIPSSTLSKTSATSDTPVLTLPIDDFIDPQDELDSLVIYEEVSSLAVTRIELLSPANMPQGSHYGEYISKRNDTLRSGIRLVEIDYLHQRDPISSKIPNYRKQDKNAEPYHVIVSDPRPSFVKGKTDIYSFSVLDKLPTVDIPLENDDIVTVSFTDIYNVTYTKRMFWRAVDYSQEPVHMDSFTPTDQQAIRDIMTKIQAEHESQ